MHATIPFSTSGLAGMVLPRPHAAAEEGGILRCRRSAIIETLLFLIAALIIDQLAFDGTRFLDASLHPFWIILMLVTLQYGIAEALMAALLCSLFLLVGNLPEQSLTETMYEYMLRLAFLPFLWTVAALVFGGLRERQQMGEKLATCENGMEILHREYQSAKQAKEQLELRLAQERCSIVTAFKAAQALETVDIADLQVAAAELIRLSLNPKQFSLFGLEDDGLRLEAAYGWDKPDAYAHHFAKASVLAQQVAVHKQYLSVASEQDETCLKKQGILAGPIIDPKTGRVLGMLKIEDMNFMDLGIHTHTLFRIVCEWLGRAYANAAKYRATLPEAKPVPTLPGLLQKVFYAHPQSRIAA